MSNRHRRLHARRWARIRKAALRRAGYRSERSGKAGRLEVHHKISLEDGGDPYALENLEVLLRSEHIELHRREVEGEAQWRALIRELV